MRHSASKTFSSSLDELLAELDEVGPADRDLPLRVRLLRRREVGVVRQRRVAAHAEVVLHPALGGQAVVVPAHRVEDLLAAHPLEAGDQVGVGVGEDVADVQRARHGRRRGVDRVDLLARSWCGRRRRCRRPSTAPTTWPRGPRAPACPVRRRPQAAAVVSSDRSGREGRRSWPEILRSARLASRNELRGVSRGQVRDVPSADRRLGCSDDRDP